MTDKDKYFINDFTMTNYRRLLVLAARRYKFIRYDDCRDDSLYVLWRHDVDFSPCRAAKFAVIENEERVYSTYFLHIQSPFYNLFEPETADLIRTIHGLGHAIGLHFDVAGRDVSSVSGWQKLLKSDQEILENLFQVEVTSVSFHNPTLLPFPVPDAFHLGGMINSYCGYLRANVKYCSDSNGYWRFERLEDILTGPAERPLQVLTHPVWWTDEPMTPRRRIQQCIDDRAAKTAANYDQMLRIGARENVL